MLASPTGSPRKRAATPVAAAGFPLSNSLAVSIEVFQGANSVDALPLFVSVGQVNAVMPSNAPLGMVSVQLSRNNAKSNPAPARVAANKFGVFTANSTGLGPGILQNFVAQNQQPTNNLLSPATPGQTTTMWGTGLGPVSGPDNVAPPSGDLPTQVEVFVGGQTASVQYSGRSPCCSGVDQIRLQGSFQRATRLLSAGHGEDRRRNGQQRSHHGDFGGRVGVLGT